ncbi:MAG: rhodanese-like domain-containing protein [Synechococcales bacterium]|nr:rhodanese-like domain-containing protein [Synechococcales bacterium]
MLTGFLGLLVLGMGFMGLAIYNPDLLRPLIQLGVPLQGLSRVPWLGDAVLAAESPQITPQELKMLLDRHRQDILLVDVRSPIEYANARIPGAVPIPIDQIETGDGVRQIQQQLQGRRLIAYCHSGKRSHRALAKLRAAGISGSNLKGGIVEWRHQIAPKMPEP